MILLRGEDIFNWQAVTDWQTVAEIPVIFHAMGSISGIILIFISNFILYSVLKKKCNFEMNVFLYGVGFVSCCVILAFFALSTNSSFSVLITSSGSTSYGRSIEAYSYFLYILPFTLLYYSYATLLQNKEKEINRAALYLTILTVMSFVALIVFEIIKYQIPYMGVFLLLFGLYLVCCFNFKKVRLNLRGFAWSPFLPLIMVFLCWCLITLLTAQIM